MESSTHVDQLFAQLQQGDRAALGKAITLVESTRSSDGPLADELVKRCLAKGSSALRLGITGVPGVGKSTLIDSYGMALIHAGHRVAVLAIDPSSSRSSGSILGDRTRMEHLSASQSAFIRPSPSSGALGGVARRTRETILLCEAAGYDRIVIETVGVGQSELEVDRMSDLNILLMIAGAGDELQGIKRGIMEAADVLVLTKASGDNVQRAKLAQRELRNAIMYMPPRDSGRQPKVLLTSALEGQGIQELLEHAEELYATDLASGRVAHRRQEQDLYWFAHALQEGILERFHTDTQVVEARPAMERMVQNGEMSPFQAAKELLERTWGKRLE